MIVLDAYPLEAYLWDEPAAADVERMSLHGEQLVISAINLAEVVDRLVRVRRVDLDELSADLTELGLTVSGLDRDLALAAADLRSRHYHRSRRSVSIADCCAAALALDRAASLATSDPALIDLMADEGGTWISMPDSTGSRHRPEGR